METDRDRILREFEDLKVEFFDYDLVEENKSIFRVGGEPYYKLVEVNEGFFLVRGGSYIGWLGKVRGQEFVVKKEGNMEVMFWTLDEAAAYLRGTKDAR